jgi:hypothetical protein
MVKDLGMIIDNVQLYQKNAVSNPTMDTKQAFFEAVSGNLKKGKECPIC